MARYPQKMRSKTKTSTAPRAAALSRGNSHSNAAGGTRPKPRPERPRQRTPRWPANQNRLTPAQKAALGLGLKLLRLNPWLNVALSILGDEWLFGFIEGFTNPWAKSGWVQVEYCGGSEEIMTSAHATSCGVLGITTPANWAARVGTLDNNGQGVNIGGGLYRYRMGYVMNAEYDAFWNAWFHDLVSRYQKDVPINTTVTEDMVNAPSYPNRFYAVPSPVSKAGWLPALWPLSGVAPERPIPIAYLPYRQPNPFIPPILDFVAYTPSRSSPSQDQEAYPAPLPAGTPLYPPVVVGGGILPNQGHVMKPPPKGTKERKVRATGATAYLFKALAALTELGDFVDAMADGYSKKTAKEYKKVKGLDEKLAFLYRHWLDDDFDIGAAIRGLVANQVEDAIVGRIISGYNKAVANSRYSGFRGPSAPRL